MYKKHLLAIDLESWIFSESINKKNLSIEKLRKLDGGYSKKALQYLLTELRRHDQKTTFFVVGKLEEIYPGIIEQILKEGHEVGWHTHSHFTVLNKEVLREELEKSKKIIKKYSIKGFQSPTITFFKGGYKVLKEYGFIYSSSIYGDANEIYNFDGIYEIPVSVSNSSYHPKKNEINFPSNMTVKNMMQFGIPYGSSFYWGILGKYYYSKKLKESERNKKICNLFIHEWQLVTPTSKEYKKDVAFLKHPLFFPYKINSSELFKYLLAHFEFQKFIDYVKHENGKK